MGVPKKSLRPGRPGSSDGREGIALATALFGVVVVTVLAMGMWTIASVNNMSALNREDAAYALGLAEAGVAHAMSLVRGPLATTSLTQLLQGDDFTPNTSDDGLLAGYGLSVGDAVPAGGIAMAGGRYFVTLIDDPLELDGDSLTDSNGRILARCRGVTDAGASVSINVVIGAALLPAMATNGDLMLNGNPDLLGACGGAHANGTVEVSGNPTVSGPVTASDTVEVSGQINQAGGGTSTPLSHQPPVEIPNLDPMDYCDTSDFILRANGFFVTVGSPRDSVDANSDPVNGWTRGSSDPVVWNLSGDSTASGSYCIEGNVVISGNPSGPGETAIPLSVFADGSVQYSGNPKITAAHPSGALIIANGDVGVSGIPSGSADNYDGLIYAQSQCQLNGDPTFAGQILCYDDPNPAGSSEFVSENGISGNPTIRYECGGMSTGLRRVLTWYQTLGGP